MTDLSDDIAAMVTRALAEDVGPGDITAALVADETAEAQVISRDHAIVCGSQWFEETYRQLDSTIKVHWLVKDGGQSAANDIVCQLTGPARALLTGERTALNFLQTLSGTATLAGRYADAVRGLGTAILDTRKTIPGLRRAQKYAVACGGCSNHRLGLFDAILIKENHIARAGGIQPAVAKARKTNPGITVEVEVEDFEQLRSAIDARPDRILLDNFQPEDLRKAVLLTAGAVDLEASGGINLENVRAIAETGVAYISVGALTKNVWAVDFSLRFD
ncbi:MAG: carboxylating nicotinate-nucleotide diphosphorylase [Gammaproteobacteria bacterium]|nr:MAG: carboxylating nicotinate-nucleotide diphosphorylase [Gammaproteobacteria bacterium]